MIRKDSNVKALPQPAFRPGDFPTLSDSLDYAATTNHGMTFFDGRGRLRELMPYAVLRDEARATARRLLGLGLEPGDRVAVLAETRPEFIIVFYACQYAGLVPVPVPAVVNLGGRDAYLKQLQFFLRNSAARAAFASEEFYAFLSECAASGANDLLFLGRLADLEALPMVPRAALPPTDPERVAYVQYTSGSTRVARGAVIEQRAVMCNLEGIVRHGLEVTPADRVFSWLPLYHDMGLIGTVLAPVAAQLPVNYLGTRDFALRPRLWLKLMEETESTVAFSPPFGYKLAARRLRAGEGAGFDLSRWRVAGVGAEMIRPESLERFVEATHGSGFRREAFLPCYGMAEVVLAVTFSALGAPVAVDRVRREDCTVAQEANPVVGDTPVDAVSEFVNCGAPLPGVVIEVRDANGTALPDRHIGTVWVRSGSAMAGYLANDEATREVLSDGWVNTGDLGYTVTGDLYITGRSKDMVIVNGRNIWPQDLEAVAEAQHGVRPGDAMAFSVQRPDLEEGAVMLVQYRVLDDDDRARFVSRLETQIRSEFGIDCRVELVGPHALPRTSSGKPSRAKARLNYLSNAALDEQASATGGTVDGTAASAP